ncbi:hypothetical protein ACFOGJ_27365 [Marinibaculum pumilum]|uniref:Uncharacterized protein n=1 Tax=Marinibaculum pumilum TaxID=1766165 RepID=A0ABV7L8M1_9PROT
MTGTEIRTKTAKRAADAGTAAAMAKAALPAGELDSLSGGGDVFTYTPTPAAREGGSGF